MTEHKPDFRSTIDQLVNALPEKYQPIYGHPELSDGSSRDCEDRLPIIRDVAERLRTTLGRQLRVLDLGCAQGFFSLSLASSGATVVGADYLRENVEVCRALAAEQGYIGVSFIHGSIEDLVAELKPGRFDLVLGLSVFHHLVYMHGLDTVKETIDRIARCIPVGIYELAVREEPLYWAGAQPERPADLLAPYALVRKLAEQSTHLSGISRPLFFASSQYWMVGDDFRAFDSFKSESHANAMGSHQDTRRYYFADGVMLKRMSLDVAALRKANLDEFDNEVAYLRNPKRLKGSPKLIAGCRDASEVWILRETLPGQLLSELMEEQTPYAYEKVLDAVIDQLSTLEDAGLHHNDVRCWNILVSDKGEATFIDYGAISATDKDCVWPDHLLLAFLITAREIVHGNIKRTDPVRRPLLDVTLLPARYRDAFFRVLSSPQEAWTFRSLQAALAEPAIGGEPAWAIIPALNEQALLQYERHSAQHHAAAQEAQRRLSESLENAHHWYLKATEGEQEISSLNRQRQTDSAGKEVIEREFHSLEHELQARKIELQRRDQELQRRDEELLAIRAQRDESLSNAHNWMLHAVGQEQRLRELVNSRSWRLTRPLRFVVRTARSPLQGGRRIVLAIMRRVLARPALANLLNPMLRRFPALHARLRTAAVHGGMVVESVILSHEGTVAEDGPAALASAVDRLSSRGRKIHDELLVNTPNGGEASCAS